jgi:hypothetical protein
MEENVDLFEKRMRRVAYYKGIGTMLIIWAVVELIGAFYRVTILGLGY